jgi:hypothetical protein
MVRFVTLSCTGTKHMASGRKSSSSKSPSVAGKRVSVRDAAVKTARKTVKRTQTAPVVQHYAVCVHNDDYPASLELRKLYPVLEDAFAAQHGIMRVIDESGEDYLYPSDFFVPIELPTSTAKTLARIA